MGKNEEESAEQTADENNNTISDEEKNNNDVAETDENNSSTDKKNNNAEELRKVIKVDNNEENKQQEKKDETPEENTLTDNEETPTRETLEQKRAILQSIKDFDFQIKKNQEEIAALNKKLDSVSKDLDDLVSLYEIVSEQMNPFVGLSKVTKKRIEALENFTKEIEDLKTRLGDLEAFAEQTGVDLQSFRTQKENESNATGNNIVSASVEKDTLADEDLDVIIEKSLKALTLDQEIDTAIDEFIESLKDMNVN